ncbi:MAG: ATP-binding cassette domain-containing protein [Parcubacteria group bacterium]|nr:ATP-binding cassette domain-containing protein [Parcubacteria group bacterium]MCR4343083.1 ATP-binding cassette domain-containing protein [Patescibacteria group bacterium]
MNKVKQIITFSNADIGYSKTLIEKFSGGINLNDRVGILAPNGSGKTCLLQTICGNTDLLSGSLDVRGMVSLVSQVLQIPEDIKDITIEEFLDQEKLSLHKINIFLEKNFQKSFKDVYLKDISGGEFTILQIAIGFLSNPDILLLDEPTNHLDYSARRILLNLLRNFKGAVIFVSHDIWFLDNLANRLWIVEDNSIRNFQGTYDEYKKENQLKESGAERQRESLRKKVNKLHKTIKHEDKRQAHSASRGKKRASDKSMSSHDRGYLADKASDFAGKNAKKLQAVLDKTKEDLLQIHTPKRKKLRASIVTDSKKKKIYSLDSSSLYIDDVCLIKDIIIDQYVGDRYVLFGKNGSGKSSFIKALLGMRPYHFQPEAKINNSTKIVYFDQQYSVINSEKTVLENMQLYSDAPIEDIRQHLGQYLFFTQQDVDQKAKKLSGGMLARLACAMITISPIDLLILDEPTNNLDIETIQELISALSDYEGALLVISHDIDFVKKIEPDKLLFIKDKTLKNLSIDDLSEIEDISNTN